MSNCLAGGFARLRDCNTSPSLSRGCPSKQTPIFKATGLLFLKQSASIQLKIPYQALVREFGEFDQKYGLWNQLNLWATHLEEL